jgi:hypothetical protein
VAPDRLILKEGVLQKQCRRQLKEFVFVLLSDVLVYGHEIPGQGTVVFHRDIPLHQCRLEPVTTDDLAFQILSARKAFEVRAKTAAEKTAWFDSITRAIDTHVAKRKTTVGGATAMFAAVWVPDEKMKACTICGKEFSFIVRRHHCRVCGALTCDACSATRAVVEHIDPVKPVRVCGNCVEKSVKLMEGAKGKASGWSQCCASACSQ